MTAYIGLCKALLTVNSAFDQNRQQCKSFPEMHWCCPAGLQDRCCISSGSTRVAAPGCLADGVPVVYCADIKVSVAAMAWLLAQWLSAAVGCMAVAVCAVSRGLLVYVGRRPGVRHW